jgi:hypothetical protein
VPPADRAALVTALCYRAADLRDADSVRRAVRAATDDADRAGESGSSGLGFAIP